jgi:hypothetical protein
LVHPFKSIYCETLSYGVFDQLLEHFLSGGPFSALRFAANLPLRGIRIFHDTPHNLDAQPNSQDQELLNSSQATALQKGPRQVVRD